MSAKNILSFLGFLVILATVAVLTKVEAISSATIGLEIVLMLFGMMSLGIKNLSSRKDAKFFTLFILISCFHFLNSDTSDFQTYLKIFSPIIFFGMGVHAKYDLPAGWDRNKVIVFSISLIPVLVRLSQLAIHYPDDTTYSIFVNSNNFLYYVIVSTILLYIITKDTKKVSIYLAAGLILSKTIGGLLSLVIGTIIYFRKKLFTLKYLIPFALLAGGLYFLIFYSKIEIFERIHNSYDVFTQLMGSDGSLSGLKDVEYSDAMNIAGDRSDLSFLFRIKNWSEIWVELKKSSAVDILLGHGFLSVPKITSTGLVAHNDYLGLLYEFGLIPFMLLIYSYIAILVRIKSKIVALLFFAIAAFHFTENLYYNFLITAMHFFLLGITYSSLKNENPSNQQVPLYQGRIG